MPKPCACCTHTKRNEINRELVDGTPNMRVSARYGMSETAVRNHKKNHLPEALAQAAELAEIDYSRDLLEQAHALQRDTLAVLEAAKQAKNAGAMLQAIDRAQKGVALLLAVCEKLGGGEDRTVEYTWSDTCVKCGGQIA